ncbi:F420-nonreducing hydrogenase [Desulfobulbus rhabdoformis]|uniref:NADH-quinone oxidoreductase subunit B family protein n=1 Tax=Desulfobulbus rhabdoformis TaxID=34032 RepID=UPI0019651D98|nr:F420-nonreducing hydrogenase [Desulfobulbus rhabdoformis]MBM9613107.1 F420-nonreducing hydrogenase [Desulfobulbus rhabdoformis]
MANKVKTAFLLAGGCAGCEMAVVDLSEKLVDALEHLEIVFWAPTVTDVKYKDLEEMEDNSIDLAFVDGMIRNTENLHTVEVLRKKSKILVAFGACATLGGIAALGDLHTNEELMEQAYKKSFSTDNPDNVMPTPEYLLDGKYDLTIPALLPNCSTIDQVVDVDYYVGGCPPHPSFVGQLVGAIVAGDLPPAGSWLTGGKAVCDTCKRNPALTGQERLPIGEIKRTIDGRPDPNTCLLQQGYMCFGPVTQGDCGASCLNVNIPCRGCGGPIPGIKDFGARCVSTLASSMENEAVAEQFIDKYNDMAKMFYRYSHTASKFNHRVAQRKEKAA